MEKRVLKKNDATHESIANAGKKFVLSLYGAKKASKSLDRLRYMKYLKVIRGKSF